MSATVPDEGASPAPAGLDSAGLPLGLELLARAGTDRRLLGIAATVEAAFDRLPRPPGPAASPETAP